MPFWLFSKLLKNSYIIWYGEFQIKYQGVDWTVPKSSVECGNYKNTHRAVLRAIVRISCSLNHFHISSDWQNAITNAY